MILFHVSHMHSVIGQVECWNNINLFISFFFFLMKQGSFKLIVLLF